MKMAINPEYLRRNLLHCKAVGAYHNAIHAKKRLEQQVRPPKWLLAALDGIIERAGAVHPAMACYRSAVPREVEFPPNADASAGQS